MGDPHTHTLKYHVTACHRHLIARMIATSMLMIMSLVPQ